MRTLALGHAWQDMGGGILLASQSRPGFLGATMHVEGLKTVDIDAAPGSRADAEVTARTAQKMGAAWVAVDGYRFDADFQTSLRDAGLSVLVIDDEGRLDHYSANLLLNPNLHAAPSLYPSVGADTKLLLGPHFALLRREFWPWARQRRVYPAQARRLLVLLGGSDTRGLIVQLVDALKPLAERGYEIVFVAAISETERADHLRRVASEGRRFHFRSGVGDVPALMAATDIALSSAGSTCWELAFMGVPSLLLSLADNQRSIARSLDELGAARDLGWYEDLEAGRLRASIEEIARSVSARRRLGARGRQIVDGEGGHRVAMIMRNTTNRFRPSNANDLETHLGSADRG